jgi:hypothetical protein
MKFDRIERLWVSLISSEKFREFAKRGMGAPIFRSSLYKTVDLVRRYVTSYVGSQISSSAYSQIKNLCFFIGHTKSGGTMIGSLLDAHPNVMIADEIDLLKYIQAGFNREQIFHLLVKGSRREEMKGRITARRLTPYSFMVPGQWQGRYESLFVIGDSKAGFSTNRLAIDTDLFQRLQAVMGSVGIRIIQVIRNPFDPISAMILRSGRSHASAIEEYFQYCDNLVTLRKKIDPDFLLSQRYEDFIQEPENHLKRLCLFLGIEAGENFIRDCVSILYESPEKSRRLVEWDENWKEMVISRIADVDFLEGYTFE